MSSSPSALARRVTATGLLDGGLHVLAGVSGGADSTALALVLGELAEQGSIRATLAHVEHGLRDSGRGDLASVTALAEAVGLPAVSLRVDVDAAAARRGRGSEDAARAARRAALIRTADERRCDVIALAHTLDDQVETVLLRLMRGTGPGGLSGMRPRAGRFVRPLLGVRRSEVLHFVAAAGVTWLSDETNWRGGARATLRPLVARLEQVFGAAAIENVARLARLLGEEEDWIEGGLDEPARAHRLTVDATGRPCVAIPSEGLRAAARPVARRLIRRAAADLCETPPDARSVERVLDLAHASLPDGLVRLPGLVALSRAGEVVLRASSPRAGPGDDDEPAREPPRS